MNQLLFLVQDIPGRFAFYKSRSRNLGINILLYLNIAVNFIFTLLIILRFEQQIREFMRAI